MLHFLPVPHVPSALVVCFYDLPKKISIAQLQNDLLEYEYAGITHVFFDWKSVSFITSEILELVLFMKRTFSEEGRRLIHADVSPLLMPSFMAIGIAKSECYETLEEGVLSIIESE